MASLHLVTVREVRPSHQAGASGYHTFLATLDAMADYLAEHPHEVLICAVSLPDDYEATQTLIDSGYTVKT